MTNANIYDFFVSQGMTREGACAMMGNYMAESSMKANIAQRGMTKLSDEQYTAAADNGLLDFSRDQVGFGYAQWTFPKRKERLLAFAKAEGTSVGDPLTQLRFTIKELKEDFRTIWSDLCTSHDLFQLTQVICNVYENPAVKNVGTRYEYAQGFFDQLASNRPTVPVKDPVSATFPPNPSVKMIQYVMWENGYWDIEKINGYKSKEFFAKLREFTDDMEAC